MRLADLVWQPTTLASGLVLNDRMKTTVCDAEGGVYSVSVFLNLTEAKYGIWKRIAPNNFRGGFYFDTELELACWLADKVPAPLDTIT